MLLLRSVESVERLVTIDLLDGKMSAYGKGFLVLLLALVVIEVAVGVGGHDDVKAHR